MVIGSGFFKSPFEPLRPPCFTILVPIDYYQSQRRSTQIHTRHPRNEYQGKASLENQGNMEEVSADNPPANGFAIPEDQVYARTGFEMWEVIEFLVTKLEPAKREDLDPDDRFCSICRQDFGASENVELSETPVKTVCGHLFGKYCITKWLDPLCCWGLTEGAEPLDLEIFTDIFEIGKENCPTCRRVFFHKTALEPMEALAARLWLWDNVYAFAGVARSPKEERTRTIL